MTLHQERFVPRENYSEDEGPFKDIVQRDPDICNNCFRKTSDTYERNYSVTTFRGDLYLKEIDAEPESFTVLENTEFFTADEPTRGSFRACVCGVPHGTDRPVAVERGMRMAKRLCERLVGKGIQFDKDVLLDTARQNLTDPEMQGKQDTGVFASALEASL